MKYEAKVIPEGINSSDEHPLKEFLLLVGGAFAVITLLIVLLAYLSDFMVGFISPEMESEWFDAQSFDLGQIESSLSKTDDAIDHPYEDIELYIVSLLQKLKSENYQGFQFTVNLYDDTLPNAFIIPGGHIFISTALFDYVESENGLAMVLAHEMAHQYERHPIRSLGRGVLISIVLTTVLGSDTSQWLSGLLFETVTIGQLAFSRDQEREADKIAVDSLIAYYGHAVGSDEFFSRIKNNKDFSNDLPAFYQSHPGTEDRIEFLKQKIAQSTGQKTNLPKLVTDQQQ